MVGGADHKKTVAGPWWRRGLDRGTEYQLKTYEPAMRGNSVRPGARELFPKGNSLWLKVEHIEEQ